MSGMADRSEWRNDSGGWVGVVTIEPGGKAKPIAVPAGGTVFLTEDERVLTANAPKRDEDNPLTNGQLTLVRDVGEVVNRRPIGPSSAEQPPAPAGPVAPVPDETGAPVPAPDGEPAQGERAPGEEVGTPEAPAQNAAAQAAKAATQEQAGIVGKPAGDNPVRPQPEKVPAPLARQGQ
jgi:hypothetical protein